MHILIFNNFFRYCLSCQKTLMYPVYNVYEVKKNHNLRKDDDVPPKAFLVVQNLMWEVFRQDSSVENQKVNSTKSKSRSFANMKRQWECQFLKICLWTPVSNSISTNVPGCPEISSILSIVIFIHEFPSELIFQ